MSRKSTRDFSTCLANKQTTSSLAEAVNYFVLGRSNYARKPPQMGAAVQVQKVGFAPLVSRGDLDGGFPHILSASSNKRRRPVLKRLQKNHTWGSLFKP